MNELTIDGKIYISSKRAAEMTGYAKDYIGQLCREGHVQARMVGRSWYVLETSIRAHRFGGDAHADAIEASNTDPVETKEPASPLTTWEKPTYVPDMAPSMPIPTFSRPAEAPAALIEPAMPEIKENVAAEEPTTAETLTDMQAAWKEWFAQKQDTLIETPEIIDMREEEHEREEEIALSIEAFKDAHQDIEAAHHEELLSEHSVTSEAEEYEAPEPVSIVPIHSETHEQHYEEIEEESEPVLIHHASAPAREPARMLAEEEPVLNKQESVLNKQERKRAQAQSRRRRVRASKASGGAGSFILRALLVVVILVVVVVTAIGTGYAARFSQVNPILLPVFDFLGGTSTYSK
ncbi:MAG: hypothetical protein JWL88_139 [Parcubacteria group bacterium]|nr:hypothetical protein [Parcubacteria group bacterium]